MTTNDEIARLRAEAKNFRELAAIKRREQREAKARHDWLAALKAQTRVSEYVLAAQTRDARAKEMHAAI